MSDTPVGEYRESNAQETSLIQYRPYSALAIAGLVFGILSVVAFVHPFLWFVPVVAALINAFALRRLARFGPELAGRRLALGGLALSLVCGVAAPLRAETAAETQRAEARGVALQWFAYLREGQPEMAAQLQLEPPRRRLDNEDVWAYYRDDPKGPEFLRKFVEERTVRNLLALGKRAQVRYVETEAEQQMQYRANMVQLYAVTFDRDGQPTTFLVRLALQKQLRGNLAGEAWWIARASLVTEPPESWPESAAK